MTVASTAHTLSCQNCGSRFSLQHLHPQVQCPYCRHVQAVPRELLAELERYQQHVARQVQQAEQHVQSIRHSQRWNIDTPVKTQVAVAFVVMVLITVGGQLMQRGMLEVGDSLFQAGLVAIFAVLVLCPIWYAIKPVMNRRPPTAALQTIAVSCPNCGGPGELTPGDSIDMCRFCEAALIPSQTSMMHGVQHAERVARQAEMDRYRHERKTTANLYSSNSYLLPLFLFVAVSTVVPAIGYAVYDYTQGRNSLRESDLFWVLIILGGVFGLLGLAGLFYLSRKQAYRQPLVAVAHQHGGHYAGKLDRLIEWLDRYWVGPYDMTTLPQGWFFGTTAQHVLGFPTAIHFNPYAPPQTAGYAVTQRRSVVRVVVAAWEVPGAGPGHPQLVEQLHAHLSQMGYRLLEGRAGLIAAADERLLERTRSKPSSLDNLSQVLNALVRIAEARGRVPATAMP